MTNKEICSIFDEEDGFIRGTHFRRHRINCIISGVTFVLLVAVLFWGSFN